MGCDKLFLNRQFVTFWEKGSGTNFWAKNLKSCVYLLLLFLLFIYFLFLKRENIPQSLRLCVGLDPSLRFKSFFFSSVAVVDQVNSEQCTHALFIDPYKLHFLAKFSLKMGSIALFTHLKMILLQYFQFSIFNFSKISFIQINI